MTTMASQITSLTVVYSTVYSDADQRKHQSSTTLAFVWGIHRDRWIPRTKGQLRGKCFHLMTSSWGPVMRRAFMCSCRADSVFTPSQWEMALLCNDVSYWMGANLESALQPKILGVYHLIMVYQIHWQCALPVSGNLMCSVRRFIKTCRCYCMNGS